MAEINRVTLFGKLNQPTYKCVEGATVFCKLRGNPYVELEHFLAQLLQSQDSDWHRVIQHAQLDMSALAKDLTAALDRLPRGATSISGIAENIADAIERGWVYGTLLYGDNVVRSGYMLVGMLKTKNLRNALVAISRQFEKLKVEDLSDNLAKIIASLALLLVLSSGAVLVYDAQPRLVVSMLPKVHSHMAAHGLDLARLAIVPNGVSPDDWQQAQQPLRADVQDAIRAARTAGDVVVGYAGSMGEPNALDTLLDAAALLRDARLRFVLVGDGHLREHLAARVAAEGLSRVALLAPVPKAQVPALLGELDIAYIGWQRMPIYRFGIAPNKLMDYMMAGCAVLHAVDAGNDPVADAGCGLSVPAGDAAAVAEGLQRLAALTVAERRALGQRGRAYVQANHTYPVLARRFLEAVSAVHKA